MPQAATGKPVVVAVLAVVILFAIGAAAYFVMMSAGGVRGSFEANYDPAAQHAEFFPETASPAPLADYRVSAKIGAHCEGEAWGSRWHLHEYRNTGDGPISFPKIIARVKDASGESLRDVETVSNVYVLPAGQSAWILTSLPKEAASTEFTIATPERVSEHTPAVSKLSLAEFTHSPRSDMQGYTELTGRVKNTHSRSLSSVLVQAIGFDAGDKPCSYTLVYIAEKLLAPGASGSFTVIAGSWQVSVPARWEIHAWGIVEK